MGCCAPSLLHAKCRVGTAHHVSPNRKNGVPSACSRACWFAVARRNPRRQIFSAFSASDQASAVKLPLLPFKPASAVFEPLAHVHSPGAVPRTRTRKVRSEEHTSELQSLRHL